MPRAELAQGGNHVEAGVVVVDAWIKMPRGTPDIELAPQPKATDGLLETTPGAARAMRQRFGYDDGAGRK